MSMITEDGLLLIDKPAGITSYDVIRQVKKIIDKKKIGHSGTLDPFATGLLVLGVDKGTKKLGDLLGSNKSYQATVHIGKKTDTGDIDGQIIQEIPWVYDADQLEDALSSFKGTHTYATPLYSAVKIQGKPLYWYARNNVCLLYTSPSPRDS